MWAVLPENNKDWGFTLSGHRNFQCTAAKCQGPNHKHWDYLLPMSIVRIFLMTKQLSVWTVLEALDKDRGCSRSAQANSIHVHWGIPWHISGAQQGVATSDPWSRRCRIPGLSVNQVTSQVAWTMKGSRSETEIKAEGGKTVIKCSDQRLFKEPAMKMLIKAAWSRVSPPAFRRVHSMQSNYKIQ